MKGSMKINFDFSISGSPARKLVWVTDLHLDFCDELTISSWISCIKALDPAGLIITGDISNSKKVEATLLRLADEFRFPIYFIAGNHDCYHGSHAETHQKLTDLSRGHKYLRFLDQEGVIELNSTTALIGHSGWADGKAGTGDRSKIIINDFKYIEELVGGDVCRRRSFLESWADQAATHFGRLLPEAARSYENIIIVTHVPPFIEACKHEGKPTDDEYLPHFSSPTAGVPIKEIAKANPEKNFVVLCGHTHGEGFAQILPNLCVYAGGVKYRYPSWSGTVLF